MERVSTRCRSRVPQTANEPCEEIIFPRGSLIPGQTAMCPIISRKLAKTCQIWKGRHLLLLYPERGIINVGNISDSNSVYSWEEFRG
jgi:hypothetical protein